MARREWALAVGGLLAAGGCGSAGAIPFPDFEPQAVVAICHLDVVCGYFPDQATCLLSEQAQPHLYDTLGLDIASGKVTQADGADRRPVQRQLFHSAGQAPEAPTSVQSDVRGTVAAGPSASSLRPRQASPGT